MNLSKAIKQRTRELGFDLVAIAPVGPSPEWDRYQAWIDQGYAGEMSYLVRHLIPKQHPRHLLPEARSIILLGLNYARQLDRSLLEDPARGRISIYALGHDYHKLMRKALIQLDKWLAAQTGRRNQGRAFVDSAPMLERAWASQAGLGFIGKNTCLIHPRQGSWFFLGGLLVPETMTPDRPPRVQLPPGKPDFEWRFADGTVGACGACTRCLDVCPTAALHSPRQLDARRCISYLTIEQRGAIPLELRTSMGNWVFGCDLCQLVCPWNHRSQQTTHPKLHPHPDRIAPPLLDLLALTEKTFRARFAGSPVLRAKWTGFMRNVCVATGNWGAPAALPALEHHLWHSPLLVAEHAAWALARLRGGKGIQALERALDKNKQPLLRQIIRSTRRQITS
jgi:epoxyqueuosine reductase